MVVLTMRGVRGALVVCVLGALQTSPAATPVQAPAPRVGDVVAVARADCYLVVPETLKQLDAGAWVDVLLRRE